MSQSELSGHQSSASALYHCRERFLVVHRKVCQYTSIQRHISPLEAINKTAVGQPVSTRLRVDAGDPQRAELALALPTIAIGILPCLGDCLLGNPEHASSRAIVALGFLQNFLVTAMRRHSTFYARHRSVLLIR